MTTKKIRVSIFIDGFNLYFGIISMYPYTKWLNIWELANLLLKPDEEIVEVKYFTSMVSNNPPKEKRQRDFISALQTTPVKIIYGHYKSKPKSCLKCGHSWNDNEEKMTDVNISVNMLIDAMQDKFDKAILISGDSDLVPPINAVHQNFPAKRVVVAFPPNRHNNSVKIAAKESFIIGRKKLVASQFPDSIKLANGYTLQKPNDWK